MMEQANYIAVKGRVANKRRDYFTRSGKLAQFEQRSSELATEIAALEKGSAIYEKVNILFNSIGEQEQQELKHKIETLVTYGLRMVFEDEYTFIIDTEIKGRQVEMTFAVEHGGVKADILTAHGGGVVCVSGFILQLLMVVLLRERIRPILFMDEALVQLSASHRERMAVLIKELCSKLSTQMVFVTHQPEYVEVADVAYNFSLNKSGRTVVKKLGD